jgi:hypothetical protein
LYAVSMCICVNLHQILQAFLSCSEISLYPEQKEKWLLNCFCNIFMQFSSSFIWPVRKAGDRDWGGAC